MTGQLGSLRGTRTCVCVCVYVHTWNATGQLSVLHGYYSLWRRMSSSGTTASVCMHPRALTGTWPWLVISITGCLPGRRDVNGIHLFGSCCYYIIWPHETWYMYLGVGNCPVQVHNTLTCNFTQVSRVCYQCWHRYICMRSWTGCCIQIQLHK